MRKCQPQVDWGKTATFEGGAGAKWNMILACGRDRKVSHGNIMKVGGEEGRMEGHQVMQVIQLGLDPMSFWPQSLCTESLCYFELYRKIQRVPIKAVNMVLYKKFIYIVFQEGEGRERNIDAIEKHQLVASPMCPELGPNTEIHNPGMFPD